MTKLYRLINVYELDKKFDENIRATRIEIFEDFDDVKYKRAKVWGIRSYDLYPTFLNFHQSENKKVYSSDSLLIDITNLVTNDISVVEGKEIEERQLIKELIESINNISDVISKQ